MWGEILQWEGAVMGETYIGMPRCASSQDTEHIQMLFSRRCHLPAVDKLDIIYKRTAAMWPVAVSAVATC